jgi:hypothetical protein
VKGNEPLSSRAKMSLRTRVLPRALSLFCLTSAVALASVFVWSEVASAVSTRSFVLDDAASLGAGELHHVAVRSDGRVSTSVELTRVAMPDDVPIVWSWARTGDALFLGTGDDGRIYRVRGETIELFAETHQLLVSALAMGDGGVLYAGTLPEGRIFAIDTAAPPGTAPRELVRPDAAEHVWALAWDAPRHRLFAATGPEGRVYAITSVTGAGPATADVFWDSVASHVMSLALAPDGSLYAGTSDDAIVVHVTSPGHAETVFDFPGNEITSIGLANGVLAIAANEFPDPPVVSAAPTKRSATSSRAARARPGRGRVYTIGVDGRAERVWANEEGHVTRVQIAGDGTIWAGLGVDGRVVRISPDRTSAVWIDVDEREVLAMDLLSTAAPFVATGDGAAFYRVGSGVPRAATWTSRVLDATFAARWGQLHWRGSGALRFSTRSGDTERPDETWSEWSSAMTSEGPIRSPGARFLQIRAELPADAGASILAVTAFYLPENQRPVVSDVAIKARPTKRAPEVDVDAPEAPSPLLGLAWKIDNTDSDRIRYRLRYREESQTVWRDILRESETLTALEYQWSTAAIPDGYYVVSVEASDELSNPDALTLRSTSESEPLLVDNHPPSVTGLTFAAGHVRGTASDTLGPVARLEAAIDGGEWRVVFPEDDLLDTREEAFSIDVSSLAPGSHIVAVRAIDGAGNQTAAEITVTVPGAAPARRPR